MGGASPSLRAIDSGAVGGDGTRRRLRIRAGRLLRVETCRGGLELAWRARGERQARTHEVAWLINCTGPDTRLQHTDCPLIAGLLRQGLICPDELGLGLRVAEDYAVIGAAGLHAMAAIVMSHLERTNLIKAMFTGVKERRG